MFKQSLEKVRISHPLVHNITNYVTVNDCANAILACGASPIMADDIGEVTEITSVCNALNINIGTLNERTVKSMLAAGKKAKELSHPVVLDPVGAGASKLRTDTALKIINEVRPDIIRGNISEIKALAGNSFTTKGVDADINDAVTEDNLKDSVAFAKAFSASTNAVIAITGAIDICADKDDAYCIYNGTPMMSDITGTGCQLSAITAAFAAADTSNILISTAAAVCAMGICGEKARERMTALDGNSSYRNYIIDALYRLSGDELEMNSKYEKM